MAKLKIGNKTKFISTSARVIIKDGKYLCIIYRNKRWSLNVSLTDSVLSDDEQKKILVNNRITSYYNGTAFEKDTINKMITERLNFINNLINEAFKQGVDTLEYINTHYTSERKKLEVLRYDKNTSIGQAFEAFVTNKKNKLKDFNKDNSFDRYKSGVVRLQHYEASNPSQLADFNIDWVINYARYLSKPFKKTFDVKDTVYEKEYSVTKTYKQGNSTIYRSIQDLVTCMKNVKTVDPDFNPDFEAIREWMNSLQQPQKDEDNNVMALTLEQFNALKAYTPNPKFKWEVNTYNLYLFCCNTGLRYSDAVRLNDTYVVNDTIKMKAQKTSNTFEVPLNPTALEIYEKYNRDFRNKFPVSQQINKNLRKMVKKIPEFHTPTVLYEYSLGKIIEKKLKLYEALKFHSSRKTFVTMLIQNNPNITIDSIMRLTSWSDIQQIKHYLSIHQKNANNAVSLNF